MVANDDNNAKNYDGPAGFDSRFITRLDFEKLVKALGGHFISAPHELENENITDQVKNKIQHL
jgi:hypothetical protein